MADVRNLSVIKKDAKVRDQFLSLFRAILREEPCPGDKNDWNWEEIMCLARSHQIQPLIFEAASRCPEFANSTHFHENMLEAMRQVSAQCIRTQSLLTLYEAFCNAGVYPLVVKGLICRQLYGEYADHRTSGDEDLLVRKQDFFQAKQILEEQDFVIEEEVTEQQLDEVQEVSFKHADSGLEIELHINPIGTVNELFWRMNRIFENAFDDPREIEFEHVKIRTMNHTDHYLFLLFHALRHFLTGGFGIRQLSDILVYEQNFTAEINWQRVDDVLGQFDAEQFYADVHEIGNHCLGFDLPTRFAALSPEKMLEDMMETGSFGIDEQKDLAAQTMTRLILDKKDKRHINTLELLLIAAFPPKKYMACRNPGGVDSLDHLWAKRIGRITDFFKRTDRSQKELLSESIRICRRRVELLKKYGLI